MTKHIINNKRKFQGKRILELGAGSGLAGLIAQKVGAGSVMLTDGDIGIISLLNLNIETFAARKDKCEVQQMTWGYSNDHSNIISNFAPDIVIGADLLY